MSGSVILYDQDCGFCCWATKRILKWDRYHELRPVALQKPETDRLLAGMDFRARMDSFHVVTREGQVYSAGAALAPLLTLLPGGKTLAAMARGFPRMTELIYQLVSKNRQMLGALLGAQACTR